LVSNNCVHTYCRKSRSRFFRKPKLKIQHDEANLPAIYSPQRTYTDTQISRTYLRIHVRNSGGETATNCEARLITIPTVEQPYPAIQEAILGWEGSVDGVSEKIEPRKDINPKSRELVHVVFSDSSFPTIPVDPPEPKHAVISSMSALRSERPRIVENGYSPADYDIKITVTSGNVSCRAYFRLHVDAQWNRLSMRKLGWLEKRRLSDLQ
jgi:hypothetical protein